MTITSKKSSKLLKYLLKRRSPVVKHLQEPGPSPKEITKILEAAARVPDHGKLSPFYFILLDQKGQEDIKPLLRDAFKSENPDASDAKLELEQQRLSRAPVVVIVVSRIRDSKIPVWEQILATGAACQNLVLASHASGYGIQWLTEWPAYNAEFKKGLGLEAGRDHIAGIFYIGTVTEKQKDRDRPEISKLINFFSASQAITNKGDAYARKGTPELQMNFQIDADA